MLSFVYSAALSGLRGRGFQMVFLLGVLLVGWAYLASMFSPRQPQTVALDIGLSGLRFTLVLLALFWVQELVSREVEKKTVILTLAYPVSRARYILGRFCGVAMLLLVATIILSLLLLLVVVWAGQGYEAARKVTLGLPYWVTIVGIYFDALVVMAFALCLASFASVLLLPFALGMSFAILGRSLGAVLDFLFTRKGEGDQALVEQFAPLIKTIRCILPDLSRLDWRYWTL